MANFKMSLRNPSYLQSSVTLLLFFGSWGIWWSFFQLWLTREDGLNLSGSEVGTVYAVNSLSTLIIMFFFGTLQDRLGIRRHLSITVGVVAACVAPFMIWVYEPLLQSQFILGVILGSVVLSAGFMSGVGLLEALAERMSRRYDFEYGQARMWGSFGYALVALTAGFLFTIDPHLNFWAGSLLGTALLLIQIFWRPRNAVATAAGAAESEAAQPGLREMAGLLKKRSLWAIIVFVLFSWTFYTVYDQQMFPDFYTSLFDSRAQGERVYGVLNSIQVFAEAAMMGLIPVLMRKVGIRTALLLGTAVMAFRILGSAVFDDPVVISAIKMLHAVEVPLFILPIFRYFTLHFNPVLSATLYMVGFQISAQVGNVVLSQPLGALRDEVGYQPTFVVISMIVLGAGLYAFFALKRDDEHVLGDPFHRDGRAAARSAATVAEVPDHERLPVPNTSTSQAKEYPDDGR
ncbi:MFS transporter [Corynebacterium glyciniphilum]|nr:MFS transporter [Corynebacterium glyciniphilum]